MPLLRMIEDNIPMMRPNRSAPERPQHDAFSEGPSPQGRARRGRRVTRYVGQSETGRDWRAAGFGIRQSLAT
jgi:hypothetical protein